MAPQLLPAAEGASSPANQQQQAQQEPHKDELAGDQQPQPGPAGEGSLLEHLDAFMAVQRERAFAYRSFDAAFRTYLESGTEAPYRQAMSQLTAQFQGCSLRVRAVEAALQRSGQLEAAALLRVVQENERDKLRLTLSLQALKAAYQQKRFSWQLEEEDAAAELDAPSHAAELPQSHACGMGCAHQAPPAEPTETEYRGAVRESYQLLQVAITAINDALEELSQQRQDLLEEA